MEMVLSSGSADRRGLRRGIAVLTCASLLAMTACTSEERAATLGTGGAAIGAAIGARHGVGGALAGAAIGAVAGLAVAAILDEIERSQVERAQMEAARSGRVVSASYTNKAGKKVKQQTKVVRTYNCGDTRCRELSTSLTRTGGEASTSTATAREVKSGGKVDWVVE